MEKLILLKEKSGSKTGEDSFLYFFSEQKIYIMNNHRLSLWCWLNFINKNNFTKHTLIYIDQHIDCRCTDFDKRYKKFLKNINELKILDKFRKLKYDSNFGKLALIDWGNFLAFVIKLKIFKNIFLFTKTKKIDIEREIKYPGKEAFNLKNIIIYSDNNTKKDLVKVFKNNTDIVLDIDLDFFINTNNTIDKELLNEYIEIIKKYKNKIIFTTISLNTSYCDGWNNAEEILNYFIKIFNLNLEIPLKCE